MREQPYRLEVNTENNSGYKAEKSTQKKQNEEEKSEIRRENEARMSQYSNETVNSYIK